MAKTAQIPHGLPDTINVRDPETRRILDAILRALYYYEQVGLQIAEDSAAPIPSAAGQPTPGRLEVSLPGYVSGVPGLARPEDEEEPEPTGIQDIQSAAGQGEEDVEKGLVESIIANVARLRVLREGPGIQMVLTGDAIVVYIDMEALATLDLGGTDASRTKVLVQSLDDTAGDRGYSPVHQATVLDLVGMALTGSADE